MKTVEIRMEDELFLDGFFALIAPYTYGKGINGPEVAEQILATLLGIL